MQANVRRYIAYEGTVDYLRTFIRTQARRYGYERTKINYLFGIADLTRLQLPKCNNHLVSFIKVDGLSVSYIVHIFDTIKSRTMVYRSMECWHF